ncbi:MAG: 23S rRNA (adenine(2503)-C(2))-methyltransferase RlmN [bacterium]|nr:23S rRNA (adenine(2503)-C(2))-methyltransferase RlmN [bacterium]
MRPASVIISAMKNFRALDLAGLTDLVGGLGEPAYRARQLFDWLWARGAADITEMTDLPGTLREKLAKDYTTTLPRVADEARSTDGTVKLLLELDDGARVETVLRPGEDYDAACVSTMAGCDLGCTFCATGTLGKTRDLAAHEIAAQVLLLKKISARLRNVVFMGMGEPLLNYEATLGAVGLLTGPLGIGARRITVSTAGVVPGIKRLGGEPQRVKLAVSLGAPDDARRTELMPLNKKWPLAELLAACREYYDRTGRRVTFEYVLLGGFNDREADARTVVRLLARVPHKLNLIAYNPVAGLPFQSPSHLSVDAFLAEARRGAYAASVRKSRGTDIAAACGQLMLKSGGLGSRG